MARWVDIWSRVSGGDRGSSSSKEERPTLSPSSKGVPGSGPVYDAASKGLATPRGTSGVSSKGRAPPGGTTGAPSTDPATPLGSDAVRTRDSRPERRWLGLMTMRAWRLEGPVYSRACLAGPQLNAMVLCRLNPWAPS